MYKTRKGNKEEGKISCNMFYGLCLLCFFCFSSYSQDSNYYFVLVSPDSIKVTELIQYHPPAAPLDSMDLIYEAGEVIGKLHEQGFLAASVDSFKIIDNEYQIYIHPGIKYHWLNLYAGNADMAEIRRAGIKTGKLTGKPVRAEDFLTLKRKLVSWYNEHGYPFAAVKLEDIHIEEGLVSAALHIDKHQKFFFDSIIVKGDANIHSDYLRNYLGIKKGDVYNEEKVGMADSRIEEIDFVSALRPVEIGYKKKEADVYTYLENHKANRFYGIAGLISNPDEGQRLMLTGELDLLLINSFGRGEQLAFNWQKMESTTQELDAMFAYPYLFSSAVGVEFNFEMYKKDSSYLTTKPGMLFRFYMEGDHYFKFFLRRFRSSLLQEKNHYSASGENFSNIDKTSYGLGYHISRLDNKYNPQRGLFMDIEAGYGIKTRDVQDDQEKGRELESEFITQVYISLWPKNVLKIGAQAGFLGYIGKTVNNASGLGYSENELFRIGGINSLRGFNEDMILARRYSILSFEYRYLFEKNSNLFAFWDGAYYYNKIDGITEDFPFGFGIGTNLASKAGIFSISYALGKQFGNPVDIRSAKIHIGYINRFK